MTPPLHIDPAWHRLMNARIPGLNLVLPTEAQWEYACRAGTETALYSGPMEILGANNAPALDPIAWYGGNSGTGYDQAEGHDSSDWPEMQYPNPKSGSLRVKQKQPNPWDLYDMLGNVWEWCADGLPAYDADWRLDPVGSSQGGAGRVIRGGPWGGGARLCRSADRNLYDPVDRFADLGFRCARAQVL